MTAAPANRDDQLFARLTIHTWRICVSRAGSFGALSRDCSVVVPRDMGNRILWRTWVKKDSQDIGRTSLS